MKRRAVKLLIGAIVGTLSLWGMPDGGVAAQWQKGRVVAATLSGHGPGTGAQGKGTRGGDLWWTYCLSADGKFYVAASRQSPAKSGLTVKSEFRFSIAKNRMTVLNSRKERIVLRIIRQQQKTCQP
jgi:hypothetical protein